VYELPLLNVTENAVELQGIVADGLPTVTEYVVVPVLVLVLVLVLVVFPVTLMEALGVVVPMCEKNPPKARYSVLAKITVMATSRIVAIIGDTPLSFLFITGFNPFSTIVRGS
jgi:hypothetical protein